MKNEEFRADPEKLLAEADCETKRLTLDDYREAVRVLKEEKDFTFREIAEWLKQRGMRADHNAVWRAYSKGVPALRARGVKVEKARVEDRAREPKAAEGKSDGPVETRSIYDASMPWL